MFGTHRRGFDWKEIAEVLHMTRTVARATFWREIRHSRSKKDEARPSAIRKSVARILRSWVSPEHPSKP